MCASVYGCGCSTRAVAIECFMQFHYLNNDDTDRGRFRIRRKKITTTQAVSENRESIHRSG